MGPLTAPTGEAPRSTCCPALARGLSAGGRVDRQNSTALPGRPSEERLARPPPDQGKIERFHQTLQRRLRARPLVTSSAHLQRQLDEFREHYNEHRSHRALDRRTPGETYRATPKAAPAGPRAQQHYRLRYDRLDAKGKMSLRRAGRMHHLATGAAHARKRVLAFSDDTHVTVIDLTTGEILSVHLIQPEKAYWPNQNKEPGRWPGPSN
jgi:transposase InsO family protein